MELLRSLVDEPGAKARNRQNLALAYALAGDLLAAERISRLDLDEEAVQNNLAYFAALAAVEDDRTRAAGLGVHYPELTDADVDVDASRRLAAIALQGEGLELGLSPSGRWFVDLGDYVSAAAASSAWRQLRSDYPDMLGHLSRLAGVEEGRQPLLVGPLASAGRAQSLCTELQGLGQPCRTLAL
ncbi:MAG: SPOR domain-containing protein [Geminicoccaceae bacterium]